MDNQIAEDSFFSEIRFVDRSGDTKIKWEPKSDAQMRKAIQELMVEGHSFYAVEYANKGAITLEHAIANTDELTERSVVVQNETLQALRERGELQVVTGKWARVKNILRCMKTPEQVVAFAAASRPEKQGDPAPSGVYIMRPLQGG